MSRLRMVNEGFPYKNIYSGKQKVGRVFRHQVTGKYHGFIQPHEVVADTEVQAFHLVAIKSFGFDSPEEYARTMARVRAQNRAASARGRALADQYLNAKTMDERYEAVSAIVDELFKI